MNKKLLTAAVAAAIAAPAAMAGDVTIYGKVHLATSSYDADMNTGDAWDISSHASRLGFKGTEDLGGSLKAVWQIELGIDASDDWEDEDDEGGNTINNADGISYRNTFVGLTGNWGTAVIGRHDTPLKISTGALDLFGDTIADYNGNGADDEPNGAGNRRALNGPTAGGHVNSIPLLAGQGLGFVDLRVDQAIAYISPNFNGLTLAAAIVQPGMDTTSSSSSADGFAEAYSIAALYSNGPFFASLAWERIDEDLVEELLSASTTAQTVLDDEHRWRVGLGYTANGLHVGFVYEDQEHGLDGLDAQRWQISGSYTFGNNVIKAMYGENEIDCTENGATDLTSCAGTLDVLDAELIDGSTNVANTWNGMDVDQWAIGLDHNFSKRTKAYIVYTDVDVDQGQPMAPDEDEGDWDGFSLGVIHSF